MNNLRPVDKKMIEESNRLCAVPKDCSLVSDPTRPRLPADSVAVIIQCLVREDGPAKLKLLSTTGVKGEPLKQWVEVQAQGENGIYYLCFYFTGGQITNCFRAKTPKDSQYDIRIDGGDVFDDITIQDRVILTRMIVPPVKGEETVEVVPAFVICVQGARPYCGGNLYWDEVEAEMAAEEQRRHYKKYSTNLKAVEEEEKQVAKERKTVAFVPKTKGLTKTKKKK